MINFVVHDLRLGVYCIPKAASTSIRSVFPEKEYLPINEIDALGYFNICFVRHPLDRLASCWADKIRDGQGFKQFPRNLTFPEFVREVAKNPSFNIHFQPQTELIGRVDFLGKFESLNDDWKRLQKFITVPDLPHLNPSGNVVMYDPETLSIARRVYQGDLDRFYGTP